MTAYVDAHTHLSNLTVENLQMMKLAGVETVVSPVQLGCEGMLHTDTIIDIWHSQLTRQFRRARNALIRPYAMLGISMVALPLDAEARLYEELESLLGKPEVVAIGEIGFEPGSASNKDRDYQRAILLEQIRIAAKCGKLVDIHTPNAAAEKVKATEETLKLCAETGIELSKVVFDHCSADNLELVLESGANAAISVQPWRKITPDMAAEWVMTRPADRIMIDSDCSELLSDPLAVAKTAVALEKRGAESQLIQAVCSGNAGRIYGLA